MATAPIRRRSPCWKSRSTWSIRRAEIPIPAEDEVRIRIKWVGICGSDLEAYRGTRAPEFITTPARLGHEVSPASSTW